MREFTFDPAPIKFKIKSIEGNRIEITSVADIGNIVFTIFGKPDTLAEVKSKYDLEISHMKFIALVDLKDYRIAAMDNYISNDAKADILIDCLHVHENSDATDEEKQASARILTANINAFYNAYVREQELEEKRRNGVDRSDSRSRSDNRGDRRSDSRNDSRSGYSFDQPSNVLESEAELPKGQELEEQIEAPRKQRVFRPTPPKKSMKQKPVRVRTTRPKISE